MSNRIFYAVQSVSLNGISTGFQSVSVNASVDFEQVFALGCLDIYENIEGVPSVEITAERAFPRTGTTMWNSFGGGGANGGSQIATAAALRPAVGMTVANDNSTNYATQQGFVNATNMYVSSWSCNFPVDGFATESATLVGNDLSWSGGSGGAICAPTGSGGGTGLVIRRQDVSGYARLQNVSFSVDIGREDLFQLGSKSPYFRAATFPVECTSDWEYLATVGSAGLAFSSSSNADITTAGALTFSGAGVSVTLGGARNNGTNYSGGDAGGGNATITYSYIGYNSMYASR